MHKYLPVGITAPIVDKPVDNGENFADFAAKIPHKPPLDPDGDCAYTGV